MELISKKGDVIMIIKRRGKRQKPNRVGVTARRIYSTDFRMENEEEKLMFCIQNILKPTGHGVHIDKGCPKIYEQLTKEQQKNLIDKTANQILYAHSSVVSRVLSELSLISLDFSQQTEVSLRRMLLTRGA